MSAVLFLTSDLMFSSRVAGAAKTLGVSLELLADPAGLPTKVTTDCRLVLIDLSLDRLNLPAVVRAVRAAAPQAQTIAFGAHVDHAALADAKDAGCNQVLSRNQFNQQYGELVKQHATRAGGAS